MIRNLSDRWNSISLRTKITGVTVSLLTLGLLVSGIGTAVMLRSYAEQQLDQRLVTVAQGRIARYLQPGTTTTADPGLGIMTKGDDVFIALYNSDGEYLTNNWLDRPAGELPKVPKLVDPGKIKLRSDQTLQVYNLADATGIMSYRAVKSLIPTDQSARAPIIIALSSKPTEQLMAAYLTIFLGLGLAVIVVGALLTRMLVTTTFAPLRKVERTAAAIANGDFGQRLDADTPHTEVGRLNRSLNKMLSRIDTAFLDRAHTIEQMRRFVGDASHELRTPLVSLRGYAELYRMGALASKDDVGQAMDRIEKEAIRMGLLVENLLALARMDETKPLTVAVIDLLPLARDAALDAVAASPQRLITVVAPGRVSEPVSVQTGSLVTIKKNGAETAEQLPTRRSVQAAHRTKQPAAHHNHDETQNRNAAALTVSGPPQSVQKEKPNNGGAAQSNGTSTSGRRSTGPMQFATATIARLRSRRQLTDNLTGIRDELNRTAAISPTNQVAPNKTKPAAMGGTDQQATVLAEENKIRQVITNLMGNAMRFTPPDSPIEIRVSVEIDPKLAVLEIIDHGEGIPPQIRDKIFQRFWRADSSRTRETGGSGLGLAIVASIIKAHSGTVGVVDTPGGGATFRVSLPLYIDNVAMAHTNSP